MTAIDQFLFNPKHSYTNMFVTKKTTIRLFAKNEKSSTGYEDSIVDTKITTTYGFKANNFYFMNKIWK